MTTVACVRPDCAGTIDPDGYCDSCGRRHEPARTGGTGHPAVAGPAADGTGSEPCRRDACGGSMVDGYCDQCGRSPVRAFVATAVPTDGPVAVPSYPRDTAPPTPARWPGRRGGRRGRALRRRTRGAVAPGATWVPDWWTSRCSRPSTPALAVLVDPEVPERKRTCAACGEPVGRSRGQVPGRTEGFCTHCGAPFSFTPKLRPGELVGGQYQVEGCIAHGGMGWVYLARDRNVSDKWVVLKGLLDSEDPSAMAAAEAERRFLAEIEHPNIVKIHNFVRTKAPATS